MQPHQHKLAAPLAYMETLKSGCTTMGEFFYTNQDVELGTPALTEWFPPESEAYLFVPFRIPEKNTVCRSAF